ncbi:MAG: FlgD immunoglobulin-like domain containing protein [bacterium]
MSSTERNSRLVSLGVYDVMGRLVRKLAEGAMCAYKQGIYWDGKDDFGHQLPSGDYFCRLECGSLARTRKLTLIR